MAFGRGVPRWIVKSVFPVLLLAGSDPGRAIEIDRAGIVEATRASGVQWISGSEHSLSDGDVIVRNASIRTDDLGTVNMRLDDGSQVVVSENSQLSVDDFVFDPATSDGRSVLSLTKGTLRMVSGRMPSERYQLNTPVASIGVRGTECTVALTGPDGLVLKVTDGTVLVRMTATDIEYAFRAPSVASCSSSGCDLIDPNDAGRGRGRGRAGGSGPGGGPGAGPGGGPGGGAGGGPGGGGGGRG